MHDYKDGIVELSIEVTNECTLSCLHCSSGSVPQKARNELGFQDHMRLVREARLLGATVLSLSGGNPLLYSNLSFLVKAAADIGFERILLYSTGHNHSGRTVDTFPLVDYLMQLNKVTWVFSLHSHLHPVNDMLMNLEGATADIINSIQWLTHRGALVEIHMVPMRPNFMHISAVRQLCEDLGVRKMSLLRFVPQTRGRLNEDQLSMTKADFAEMQRIMHHEATRTDSLVDLRMGCPIDFRHTVGLLDAKAKPCHAGDDLMLVRPNGAVHPCAAWKSLPADSNVREAKLADIWHNSQVFTAIRQFKAEGYKEVVGCSSCTMLDSCQTGCPAQRLHAWRDGHGIQGLYNNFSDPLCSLGCS